MEIHEYQAKALLADYGVAVPQGGLAYSPEQATYRSHEIGGERWVVKAQIHSGARGQAGGIKICDNEHAIWKAADELLGQHLVTRQTGAAGKGVYRLYVEAAVATEDEFYLGLVLDRSAEQVMLVASASGGIDIEDIAASCPDAIVRVNVEPAVGLQAFQAREIAFAVGLDATIVPQAVHTMMACYRAFCDLDAVMLEINPLALTADGQLLALDAKMAFDDNALFRHQDVSELRDKSQEDRREMMAADRGLSYVGLDGDIGCIINGAGLAMATLDMIEHYGGRPANFLDIGGGASAERVLKAFRLVLSNENVKTVLVNIFAGINRCDWVAEGVVQAMDRLAVSVPVVVRLSGTNTDEGQRILAESDAAVITAGTLAQAAVEAVRTAASSATSGATP